MSADIVLFLLYHLTAASVTVLLAQSLNLIWKSGLYSLGHHGYMAVGAYSAAFLVRCLGLNHISSEHQAWPSGFFIFTCLLACGTLTAGISGYFTGRIFSKLQGDYFAVATLVLGELVYTIVANTEFVGGGRGFEGPNLVFVQPGLQRAVHAILHVIVGLAINVVMFLMLRRLDGSVIGLALTATHDDPLAAKSAGIDVKVLRQKTFTLGTAVAGLGGAFFFLFHLSIVPDDFRLLNGLPFILCVILGRLKTKRCVIVAVVFYCGYELLKLQLLGLFGLRVGQTVAEWKEVILALFLVLSVVGPPAWKDRQRGNPAKTRS